MEAGTWPCRVTLTVLVSSPLLSLASVFPLLPFLIALPTCHEMSVFQPTFIKCHCVCALGEESMSTGRPCSPGAPCEPSSISMVPALKRDAAPGASLPFVVLLMVLLHPSWSLVLLTILSSFFCGLLTPTKVVFRVVFCLFCYTLLFAILLQVFLRLHVTSCFWSLSLASQAQSWCHYGKG